MTQIAWKYAGAIRYGTATTKNGLVATIHETQATGRRRRTYYSVTVAGNAVATRATLETVNGILETY